MKKLLLSMLLLACWSAAGAQPKSNTFGDWSLVESVDKMTDEKVCLLRNRKHPRMFYTTQDRLILNYRGYGGVAGFQYRVDQKKASEWHSNDDRDGYDSITIYSWKNELPDGTRLRISGLTLLKTSIDEEINLTGLKEGRTQMLAACKVEDPWAKPDTPWPSPTESVEPTK